MAKIKEITEILDRENDQIVHFIITENGKDYNWTARVIPKVQDVQAHLEADLGKHVLLILGKMYPGARGWKTPGIDDLSSFKAWIAAGHTNPAVIDSEGNTVKPSEVIQKVPFRSTHPPEVAFRKAFKAATTNTQKINILAKAILKILD